MTVGAVPDTFGCAAGVSDGAVAVEVLSAVVGTGDGVRAGAGDLENSELTAFAIDDFRVTGAGAGAFADVALIVEPDNPPAGAGLDDTGVFVAAVVLGAAFAPDTLPGLADAVLDATGEINDAEDMLLTVGRCGCGCGVGDALTTGTGEALGVSSFGANTPTGLSTPLTCSAFTGDTG